MGAALNTMVNGSTGTCVEAADWLRQVAVGADECGDGIQRAKATAMAGWDGPAANAFLATMRGTVDHADRVAKTAKNYERALREFVTALDGVIGRMNDAISKAEAGGLRLDGPFILQPEPFTAKKPGTPTKLCTAEEGVVVTGHIQGSMEDWNAARADHNRKVRVFNDCKKLVHDARNAEDEAHRDLQHAFSSNELNVDTATIASTSATQAMTYVAAMENPRSEALAMANRSTSAAQFFDDWAAGTRLNMSDADKELLQWASEKARGNSYAYTQRAHEFARFVDKVPEPVRQYVAAYPGKKTLEALPEEAAAKLRGARAVLKGMPYLGSTLTVGTELYDAAQGEQSWGKAAVDSTFMIGGGALGAATASAAAAAIWGAPLGPVGSFVTGTIGGIAGMIGGQEVADWLVPE